MRLQPCSAARHVPLEVSLPTYDGPEGRFCPAKVYEFLGFRWLSMDFGFQVAIR